MAYFLESDRLYLRDVRLSDAGGYYPSWLNDCEVNQYLETRFDVQTVAKTEDFIREQNSRSDVLFLAICLKENDKHIGNIKLGPINYHHRTADVGYMLGDKGSWGKGLMTEAIRLVLDFGFRSLDLAKISAGAYKENIGSQRCLEKCGFTREGILRGEVVTRQGKRSDCYRYGILRDEYMEMMC